MGGVGLSALLFGARENPLDVAVQLEEGEAEKGQRTVNLRVKLPVAKAQGACVGTRFRVVLDRSTQQPLAMLFALQGDDWKLCSTAKA